MLDYQLHEENGGTLVRFSITGRPTGLMRVLQPVIARQTQANLDRAFPRLKEVLEAQRPAPARPTASPPT